MMTEVDVIQLAAAADEVWRTMANLPLALTPSILPLDAERPIECSIRLRAADTVTLHAECSPLLTRPAAAAMFSKPTSAVTLANEQDSLLELTNMVAGKLKTISRTESRLSIPRLHMSGLDTPVASYCRCQLRCRDGRMTLSLVAE